MYDEKTEPMKWVIKVLLPAGVGVLAGKANIGKSVMALNFAVAVASGADVLGGFGTTPGEVIYFALEDTERRIQTRVKTMAPDVNTDVLNKITIVFSCPPMGEGGFQALEELVRKHPDVRLVIIDTLVKFNQGRAGKVAVKKIKDLANKYNFAVLLVHRALKKEAVDLPGSDVNLFLERKPLGRDAVLYVRGTGVEPKEITIRFDLPTFSWHSLGDTWEQQITKKQLSIVNYLKGEGRCSGPKEIAENTSLTAPYVRKTLPKLIEKGLVVKVERGRYEFAKNQGTGSLRK